MSQENSAEENSANGEAAAPITEEDVRHVARLARIALDDADVVHFTTHLGKVLNHAKELESLELDDVPMWRHPYGLSNVLREDETDKSKTLNLAEVLDQAPETDSRGTEQSTESSHEPTTEPSPERAKFFKVPPVLGDAP